MVNLLCSAQSVGTECTLSKLRKDQTLGKVLNTLEGRARAANEGHQVVSVASSLQLLEVE